MANRKSDTYNKNLKWQLYVIFFPTEKNCFYIGKSSQNNLYTTFKNHCILMNAVTRPFVEKCKSHNLVPEIYLLEKDFDGTQSYAFSRMVAWVKLLSDNKYICINEETLKEYSEDMIPRTEDYYNEIKDINVANLLDKNNSLFPNYRPRKKQNRNKNQLIINLNFKPNEFELLETRAVKSGFTKTRFCKQMILNGEIYIWDTSDFIGYIKELQEGISTMQQAILTIHKLGQYFPSDLAKIEEFKNTVQEHYSLFLKEATKINNKISDMNVE